jgi:hypothetical protein
MHKMGQDSIKPWWTLYYQGVSNVTKFLKLKWKYEFHCNTNYF